MKYDFFFFALINIVLWSCGKSSNHSGHEATEQEDNPNQALYYQVMDIHDEVMPRMEDIYKLKKDIQDKIAKSPDMVMEKKQHLERIITNLDSVNTAMMDWMHNFKPLPDSVDEEKAREYLETEMERIKKVRDAVIEAIDKAKEEVEHK